MLTRVARWAPWTPPLPGPGHASRPCATSSASDARHLATEGAAALSLRAVARDLGLVSSAVYRYVASRDELLTLLVVDGYDELGDAVDAALERVDTADFAGRLAAIGRATRAWALAEPATYALLFGSPVPGYEAPAEQTTGPGIRVAAGWSRSGRTPGTRARSRCPMRR